MTTQVLVGYDRSTERMVEEFPVPPSDLDYARGVAGVPPDDPEVSACYPLSPGHARDLAGALGVAIDTTRRDYFLEGFAD